MAFPEISRSRAVERAALVELLRVVQPGDVVTYAVLAAGSGCPLPQDRHVLTAAREDVLEEEFVFEAIRTVGLRRLTESERATVAPDRRRRRSFRQANMALREMRGLETAALSNGERQQFLGRLALLSAVAAVASTRALRKVLTVSVPDSPVLPVGETLSLLADVK